MTGSWKGRGNQYIEFVRVLYCKLPTNGKQLPALTLEAVPGIEPWPQRWEVQVLPLCHHCPVFTSKTSTTNNKGDIGSFKFGHLRFSNSLLLQPTKLNKLDHILARQDFIAAKIS